MKTYTIEDLKKAFEAGESSVKSNQDRDTLLESGTKQCPEKQTFESWYEVFTECQSEFKSIKYNRWPGEPMGTIG